MFLQNVWSNRDVLPSHPDVLNRCDRQQSFLLMFAIRSWGFSLTEGFWDDFYVDHGAPFKMSMWTLTLYLRRACITEVMDELPGRDQGAWGVRGAHLNQVLCLKWLLLTPVKLGMLWSRSSLGISYWLYADKDSFQICIFYIMYCIINMYDAFQCYLHWA